MILRTLVLTLTFASFCHSQQPRDPLARYAACDMPDGPAVVETAPLGAGVTSRPVHTLKGRQTLAVEAGRRIVFAYPGEDPYANLKAEHLPAASYADEKRMLIEDFDSTLAAGDSFTTRNYALKPKLNRFEIYGLDQSRLEGSVLGIYLFFDDIRHDAITIYFLNQEPKKRFHTVEEYTRLRDDFLENYTYCLSTQTVTRSQPAPPSPPK
jgi:hypothetical protein